MLTLLLRVTAITEPRAIPGHLKRIFGRKLTLATRKDRLQRKFYPSHYSNLSMREKTLSKPTPKNHECTCKTISALASYRHYSTWEDSPNSACSDLVRDLRSQICYSVRKGRVLWTLLQLNSFSLIRFNSFAGHEQENNLNIAE